MESAASLAPEQLMCRKVLSHLNCVVCGGRFENDDGMSIGRRGIETVLRFSETRGDDELYEYLSVKLESTPVGRVRVHGNCRKQYTDQRKMKSADHEESPTLKSLRSTMSVAFGWKMIVCYVQRTQTQT